MTTNRRFFLEKSHFHQKSFSILDEQVRHIRTVLRMQTGDKITLLDGEGTRYTGSLTKVTSKVVTGKIISKKFVDPPVPHITLAQAIGRGDAFEDVIVHGTELGLQALIPLFTDYTVVKSNHIEKKNKRWRRLAISALKQSDNPRMLDITDPLKLTEIDFELFDFVVPLDPQGETDLSELKLDLNHKKNVVILVGPEGGFSTEERKLLSQKHNIYKLRGHTLRNQTASLAILSILQFLSGNL